MSIYSGLRGRDLAIAIIITPLLVPIWCFHGVAWVIDGISERWWNQ